MCWNHVVWCCFHWEKCKKPKKTRHFWKSFTSYLCNGSTLEHNSNRFKKLQSRATTFIFWPFLIIGHVTIIPTPYQMDPDRYNHPNLVFLHFLVKPDEISFFRVYAEDPDMDPEGCTSLCIYCIYHPYFFLTFCIFFAIFSSETHKFPFLDIYTGPWQQHPTILTTIPIFFWFFPYFIAVFHLKT